MHTRNLPKTNHHIITSFNFAAPPTYTTFRGDANLNISTCVPIIYSTIISNNFNDQVTYFPYQWEIAPLPSTIDFQITTPYSIINICH